MIESYRRFVASLDRPSVLIRLATAFITSWAIFFAQVTTLDLVPPDSLDKGTYCLQALGHTVIMATFRIAFPWLVAVQIVGSVLIALRLLPVVWVALVVLLLFWQRLVDLCP
ncbi:hypothetical protein LJ725_25990 [Reyranella aquatilis]|uniref:Uncharacterized protein n=1 Tax=Reyranella aquatilis TaxID=2035356 RepID=A0ABS8L269_9HYPH|nr:hypothetical protein [Reyranella aquatilis]MCC8432442.1 hypothetical protein [Reyranella aquatilis]